MLADNGLVEMIKEGDKSAFESLFRSQYSSLCTYANKFVQDVDTSEEIVQELFSQIWQKKEDLNITGSIESYLFRAVHNSCLNFIKHESIKDKYKQQTISDFTENIHAFPVDMEVNELHKKNLVTIDLLPQERKKVFTMNRFEGFKYKEIAEKLNISVKTVENQMGKALKFLRDELKEYLPLMIFFFFELFSKIFKN